MDDTQTSTFSHVSLVFALVFIDPWAKMGQYGAYALGLCQMPKVRWLEDVMSSVMSSGGLIQALSKYPAL